MTFEYNGKSYSYSRNLTNLSLGWNVFKKEVWRNAFILLYFQIWVLKEPQKYC